MDGSIRAFAIRVDGALQLCKRPALSSLALRGRKKRDEGDP